MLHSVELSGVFSQEGFAHGSFIRLAHLLASFADEILKNQRGGVQIQHIRVVHVLGDERDRGGDFTAKTASENTPDNSVSHE